MEPENTETPCYVIFKSDADKVYAFVCLEYVAYAFAAIGISLTVDMNGLGEMRDLMGIAALVYIIFRIIVAILILKGNKTENLRLLWLGVVGQRVTFGLNVLLALMGLLIFGELLPSIQILCSLSMFPFCIMALVGMRIEKIKINSDADTNTA